MSNKNKPIEFSVNTFKSSLKVNPIKVLAHQKKQQPMRPRYQQQTIEKVQAPKTKNIVKPPIKAKQQKELPYKTKMCPNGRDCKRQFTCRFAHHQKQLRRVFHKRTKPCMMYQRGMCGLGSACREYHGNFDLKNWNEATYKKTLCQDFEKGDCVKGQMCVRAHGKEQLEQYANLEQQKPQLNPNTQSQNPKQLVIQLQSYKPKSYTMTIVQEKQQQVNDDKIEVLGTFDLFATQNNSDK